MQGHCAVLVSVRNAKSKMFRDPSTVIQGIHVFSHTTLGNRHVYVNFVVLLCGGKKAFTELGAKSLHNFHYAVMPEK
ncbi:unnamed protein product [Linum trigynum]|uniref:Uncharacterized protein n=1 Tax=Linum trigynum TaxID=586398 RepID=A0AAV2E9N6_9ROSI